MFKRKCKITFIAHGSTIYSEDNRLTDKLDYPPLNENGELELEKIVEKKVYLELEVKVEKDWRKKQNILKNFGYQQEKD